MKHIHKLPPVVLLVLFILLATITSCEKVDDPFVPRAVASVLVAIDGIPYGDFSTEPSVSYDKAGNVTMSARILELDKTNILDYTKGIDSIPVANVKISIVLRTTNKVVAEATTDAKGKISITKSWSEMGLTDPKSGNSVALNWSGTYKSQAFTRLSRIAVK